MLGTATLSKGQWLATLEIRAYLASINRCVLHCRLLHWPIALYKTDSGVLPPWARGVGPNRQLQIQSPFFSHFLGAQLVAASYDLPCSGFNIRQLKNDLGIQSSRFTLNLDYSQETSPTTASMNVHWFSPRFHQSAWYLVSNWALMVSNSVWRFSDISGTLKFSCIVGYFLGRMEKWILNASCMRTRSVSFKFRVKVARSASQPCTDEIRRNFAI